MFDMIAMGRRKRKKRNTTSEIANLWVFAIQLQN